MVSVMGVLNEGQLIALIRAVEWEPDIAGSTVVDPPPETMPANPQEWESISPDSPWAEGPWVTELSSQTRDTLAAVDDSQIPAIAARWRPSRSSRATSTPTPPRRSSLSSGHWHGERSRREI